MRHPFHLARLVGFGVLVALTGGCGGGAATGDLDHIQVTVGRFDVSLANTAGHPLLDVVVQIVPVGSGRPFVARPDRIESGEQRTLAHTSFIDHDSVPFSPRTAKASRVVVTAKDLDGKPVRVDVPFKS